MKVTNGDIYVCKDALQRLTQINSIPAKYGYPVAKAVKKLQSEIGTIDQVKNGLIRKYGIEGKGGNIAIDSNSPNWKDFVKEFNELMAIEVDLNLDKVKVPDSAAISVDDLMNLEHFVEIVEVK